MGDGVVWPMTEGMVCRFSEGLLILVEGTQSAVRSMAGSEIALPVASGLSARSA